MTLKKNHASPALLIITTFLYDLICCIPTFPIPKAVRAGEDHHRADHPFIFSMIATEIATIHYLTTRGHFRKQCL